MNHFKNFVVTYPYIQINASFILAIFTTHCNNDI